MFDFNSSLLELFPVSFCCCLKNMLLEKDILFFFIVVTPSYAQFREFLHLIEMFKNHISLA